MGAQTGIEWTDATWTPIRARNRATGKVGWFCIHESEACRFCYAEVMNRRLGTGVDYKAQVLSQVDIFLDEAMLLAPLRWKKPRRIFVCSMTDLFADFVSDEFIDRMFAVMALTPQHTYQVLTKRPQRMREYCHTLGGHHESDRVSLAMKKLHAETGYGANGAWYTAGDQGWHFANIWLGTSCEDQKAADARIPHLLATPAAIRFLSCEPLLGPIDLAHVKEVYVGESFQIFNALDHPDTLNKGRCRQGIDWVIAGGESGPHARPMHPDWARLLRDQCAAADIPFFFKQWGEWMPSINGGVTFITGSGKDPSVCWPDSTITASGDAEEHGGNGTMIHRIGKKRAGRKLDAAEHNAFPEIAT
jgi:protein gp37